MVILSFCVNRNKKILNHETMVNVLVDMHLCDAMLQQRDIVFVSNEQDSIIAEEYYNSILNKYNINRYIFSNSLDYYTNKRTQEYEAIYTEVLERFAALEEENATMSDNDISITK